MKAICTFIVAICCFSTFAQSLLPLDEHKKIQFVEVVKVDSLDGQILYAHAKSWLLTSGYHITSSPQDSLSGKLIATNDIAVYARGYMFKKLHGKIVYTTIIEVKENKYRYTFNNFVFHYYKEDRSHEMVPSGKTKALEDQKASGWQSLWENHQKHTFTTISHNIASLKTSMMAKPEIKKEPAVASKKENLEKW